jgi:hypothetical protein
MPTNIQSEWFRGPSADLGDTIDQSLRFRGGQSLNKTFGSSHDYENITISMWFKRSKLSAAQTLITLDNGGNNIPLNLVSDDRIRTYLGAGTISSDGRFRDTSAWYHAVVNSDKLWINNELIYTHTLFDNYAVDNRIYIGTYGVNNQEWFDGYLADVQLISNAKLDPTSFGKYNNDGVWVPQDYTGNYGASGFHLDFADSSNPGNDVSGNNNDFSHSGFGTGNNADHDVDYSDTPTNNFATLNGAVASDQTTNEGALKFRCESSGGAFNGSTSTLGVSSGKWYWEGTCKGSSNFIGIIRDGANDNINAYPGQSSSPAVAKDSANGWGIYSVNGSVYHNASPYSYGTSYTTNDVIGIAMDLDNNAFWVSKNGTWYNSATQSEIEAGTTTNAAATNLTGTNFRARFSASDSTSNGWDVNFGQRAFAYTKPTGFEALQSSKVATPTIKNGKDHFDAVTWTGDLTSRSITGLNFQPDFVWIKCRDTTFNHNLVDSVRGSNKILYADLPDSEATIANVLTSFNSDGFSVSNNASSNNTGNDYVAWCWKAGGTAVSNTDGTITSSVSANTDAGFSIVSYTGNATSGATIGHGLNSAPQFMIVRNRDDAEAFAVYHHEVDNTAPQNYWMRLDNDASKTSSSTHWNNTAPTNSVFTVGNANATNGSAGHNDKIIAYCWHEVEGFSKFGVYTGNNDPDGPFIYTGFRPAFVLIKRTDSAASQWLLMDTTRDTNNPNNLPLTPSVNDIEDTAYDRIDIYANGFKNVSSWAANNASGSPYLYIAFAENPFAGENTPPATALG